LDLTANGKSSQEKKSGFSISSQLAETTSFITLEEKCKACGKAVEILLRAALFPF